MTGAGEDAFGAHRFFFSTVLLFPLDGREALYAGNQYFKSSKYHDWSNDTTHRSARFVSIN